MIAVYFPQTISLQYDDGASRAFRPVATSGPDASGMIDPRTVYLTIAENLEGIARDCRNAGLGLPTRLADDFLRTHPLPPRVADLLAGEVPAGAGPLRVCLFNGGGGGLGDGIMFAPALEILQARLAGQAGRAVHLDVWTGFPSRIGAVLAGLPGVTVRRLPLSLADFLVYDAYVDFSGMLLDESFQSSHMTDFFLDRMGFAPEKVPEGWKEPFLRIDPDPFPELVAAVESARQRAGGRLLVAVIFTSAHARTMPDHKAAELIRCLADEEYQPVLIFPPGLDPAPFMRQYGLLEAAVDLSFASPDYDHFIALLARMDGIVSVDTSAVHIGGALRRPTVGIFNSIPAETRIRYSPTVAAVQLDYRGRTCRSPCGISKARVFVKGQLADGRGFHMEFGHACDESVDKDELLNQAIARVNQLDYSRAIDDQLAAIRAEFQGRFATPYAPCWDALRVREVVEALAGVMKRESGQGEFPCPVCSRRGRHRRCDRFFGRARYSCRACGADFFGAEKDLLPGIAPGRAELPRPDPGELRFVRQIAGAALSDAPVLCLVDRENPAWYGEWVPAEPGRVEYVDWRALDRVPDRGFGLVVLFGILDLVPLPRDWMIELGCRLRNDPVWLIGVLNRDSLWRRCGLHDSLAADGLDGPGWRPATLARFLDLAGLDPAWAGTTPLSRDLLAAACGACPPLRVQPPGLNGVIIQLTGQDLAGPIENFVSPLLGAVKGQGRYLVTLARRGKNG